MKRIFLFTALIGLFLGVDAQDTLKLKTVNTYYGKIQQNSYFRLGKLDGTVINMDTLEFLIPEIDVVNVSNETFTSDVSYEQAMDLCFYDDGGNLLLKDSGVSSKHPIMIELLPDDTVTISFMGLPLMLVLDDIKTKGIDFEQISYWKIITGISFTSKDGTYSDKVFYEGADTSIFYIVKGGAGIEEMKQNVNSLSLYPNPATTQLTLDNKDALIKEAHIYDITGREINRHFINATQSTLDISTLKLGLYIIKIHTEQGVLNRKVQVVK